MILSDLRDYIKHRHKVALIDLINHFHMDGEALRGMLSKWVSKGKVKKTTLEKGCSTGCCKCDPALTEFYEWVE
ncbi:MAG: sugar metabolism transcriptional regulator [Gammaproteobacteria bacterium HGW-Gammaproteobacteria-3]|nr:MAG: sugar metabolism transcriptional regulator [Gammaproteobacteria bacterium HGW-Gammaproteobacteria-3]